MQRIMDAAEHLSLSHIPLEIPEKGVPRLVVDYYNAKRVNMYHKLGPTAGELLDNHKELILTNSRHFGNVGVNVSVSAVHVPTNVYDGGNEPLNKSNHLFDVKVDSFS